MDDITCIDIIGQEKLASEEQLYYPFLTIFNQQLHWYSPATAAVLKGVRDGAITREKPYVIEQSCEEKRGELFPLTSETLALTAKECAPCTDCIQMKKKSDFFSPCGLTAFGFIHQLEGRIVGGVEWMPSLQVSYPIPKDMHTALLARVYHSSEEAGYKVWPLQCMERELFKIYRGVLVIYGRESTFPNGAKGWFERQGYCDLGSIQVLDGCTGLYLLKKERSE